MDSFDFEKFERLVDRNGKTAIILKNQGKRQQKAQREATHSMLDVNVMYPGSDKFVEFQARFSDSRSQSQKEFCFL